MQATLSELSNFHSPGNHQKKAEKELNPLSASVALM